MRPRHWSKRAAPAGYGRPPPHAVLSGPAVERLRNSPIDQVVLLDTIALPPEKRLNKFTVLPSAPVFAEAIRRIAADQSVWALFE